MDTIYCPFCGEENTKDSAFCKNCGRKIQESEQIISKKDNDEIKTIISPKMKAVFIISLVFAVISIMPIFNAIMILGIVVGTFCLVINIIQQTKNKNQLVLIGIFANIVTIINMILWLVFISKIIPLL